MELKSSTRSLPYTTSDYDKRRKVSESPEQTLRHFTRVLNTAIVSTRVEAPRNLSHELKETMNQPAFRAILKAAQHLSVKQGISEKEAAEQIIRTFRKLDDLWGEYLVREGVEKIRKQ